MDTTFDITSYVKHIRKGEVVAFPTETVYGLGVDAWNPLAIYNIFEIKGRPADNPLIVHIANISTMQSLVQHIPSDVVKLIEHFWPGPLTIILPKVPRFPDIATANLDTVALRMPDHPLALGLIRRTGPLVAPSANKSGRPSPTHPSHIREDFGNNIKILDGGSTRVGLESTVLDCSQSRWQILRPGSIGCCEIQQVIDKEVLPFENSDMNSPRSPGQKYRHYAPEAKVEWLADDDNFNNDSTLYLLHSCSSLFNKDNIINFEDDFERMARQLYDLFRFADKKGFKKILIRYFSKEQSNNQWVIALQNRINKAIH